MNRRDEPLPVGPELDAAVAEAIFPQSTATWCATSGCIDLPIPKDGSDPDVMAIWKHPDIGRNWVSCPRYSTDLNHAFEAAEKCGLFIDHDYRLSVWRPNPLTWAVHDDGDFTIGSGSTPAEAICRAILKVTNGQ